MYIYKVVRRSLFFLFVSSMMNIEDDGSKSIASQSLFIDDDNELLSLRSKSPEVST
jgi:hypothetical protein